MIENRHPNSVPRHALGPPVKTASKRVGSGELMQGTCELIIEHSGAEYRLRITSKGKLILTK
ncbi:MAG: hemin uptake protein HemP [Gammaproteobacteria bacterium]|nr:hemin uptake protein HemP [Gammaproteobacteria bacterium]